MNIMYIKEPEFELIAELLDQELGREATDAEILAYIEELEAKHYDNLEESMKGN